jgi:hypothetical protein
MPPSPVPNVDRLKYAGDLLDVGIKINNATKTAIRFLQRSHHRHDPIARDTRLERQAENQLAARLRFLKKLSLGHTQWFSWRQIHAINHLPKLVAATHAGGMRQDALQLPQLLGKGFGTEFLIGFSLKLGSGLLQNQVSHFEMDVQKIFEAKR